MFKALACAINGLTEELRFAREERECERAQDERLLQAVLRRAEGIKHRVSKLARKLGKLDAST